MNREIFKLTRRGPCCILVLLTGTSDLTAAPYAWMDLGGGTLKDKESGLQWTREDNGQDVNWNDAKRFCADKKGGWRLPSVEELEALFNGASSHRWTTACGKNICRAPDLFRLSSSWFWSSTRAGVEKDDALPDVWGVLLVNGARTSTLADIAFGSRTLCVR
jgi:hypothetical protein